MKNDFQRLIDEIFASQINNDVFMEDEDVPLELSLREILELEG